MDKGYLVMDRPRLTVINSRGNNYVPPQTSGTSTTPPSWSCPSDQPPSYTNDYLTPTSPQPPGLTHAQVPEVPAFPVGGFNRCPQSSVISRESHGQQQPVPRTDSGIEADFKRDPLSSTSSANPRSSTIYESIDATNGHYIDPSLQVNLRGRSDDGPTSSSGFSPGPPTVPYLTCVASDSEDGQDDDMSGKHRLHPVYNSLTRSTPMLCTKTCHCSKTLPQGTGDGLVFSSTATLRMLRCMCCGLVAVTVIAVGLLAVVAYLFFSLVPGMQAHIRTQEDEIRRIGAHYQNLSQRVGADTSVPEGVVVKITELNDTVQQFDLQLRQIRADVTFQINNISRAPDLKGVSALGDLGAACFYYNTTTAQALPGPSSTTSWLPEMDSDLLRENVVMSVTCGVKGGTLHLVETRVLSPSQGRMQYRCRCEGKMPGHTRRLCHIHLVLCPRFLPVDLASVPAG